MRTYSFLNCNSVLVGPGGVINLAQGAGPTEEGITIDPASEINTTTIGADGEGMHSLHADKSGTLTIRLLKTSPVNGLLAAMFAFQTANAATHGLNTITTVDLVAGETVTCQQVAFVKAPSLGFGKEATPVEWVFSAIKIDRVLGL